MKRLYIQKSIFHYGQGKCVSAPTATNYYLGYNTNNTFPLTANPARNTDATEAMKQAEGSAGGGVDFSLVGMYLHFQFGGHQPMIINMASIDFSRTSQRELGLAGMKPNGIRNVNLFKAGVCVPAALAFGNVRMKYHGNDQFSIVGDDNARFDFSPLVGGYSLARDAGNLFGAYISYNLWAIPISPLLTLPSIINGPYDIKFIGTTKIPE